MSEAEIIVGSVLILALGVVRTLIQFSSAIEEARKQKTGDRNRPKSLPF